MQSSTLDESKLTIVRQARSKEAIDTLADQLPLAIFASFLLFPVAMLALQSSTLTGMSEESVGYRYFYTLRSLYEGTYLFLPQGELVNLIFKGIHLALTAIGHPTTELFPRIDYFTYAAIAALHVVTIACFWWGTRPITRVSSKIATAAFWALLYYIPETSAVYAIIQPDYIVAFPAFSLLTLGVILRIQGRFDWSPRVVVGFALFVGAALSVKLTLAIMACIALLHALIMSNRPLVGFATSALSVLLGIGCWTIILLVELGGAPSLVASHFVQLSQFMQSSPGVSANDLNWTKWIISHVWQPPSLLTAIYAAPALAALTLLLARKRWEISAAASMLVGFLAYGLFLFKRDYAITALECLFPLAALITIAAQFSLFRRLRPLRLLLIPGAIYGAFWYYPKGVGSLLGSAAYNTVEQRTLRELESGVQGKLLWLVETNNERPMSVDSAIMKGGFAYSGRWLDPPSAIMHNMFPDRDFRFYVDPANQVNIKDYGAVMFIYRGNLDTEAARIAKVYSTSFAGLSCKPSGSISSYTYALCEAVK
jgi:hypothetical protein